MKRYTKEFKMEIVKQYQNSKNIEQVLTKTTSLDLTYLIWLVVTES